MISSLKHVPVKVDGRTIVGIDVGKQKHAAAAISPQGIERGPVIEFPNTRSGIDRLQEQVLAPLGRPRKVLVALEATGHYWMPLYWELARRGYASVVINPIQTRAKFRTRIRKTKTDQLDARSIAQLILSGEAKAARIPEEPIVELRLLTRHRWRLVDMAGDLDRFAQSLIDRVFPEYAGILCKPLLPTGRALIREIGLAPDTIASRADEVTELLERASRHRLHPDKIRSLIRQSKSSIGIRQAEDVLVRQLRSVIDLMEAVEAQVRELEDELDRRVTALDSPLGSLGIKAPLIATIHAESDPMTDFPHPWQYAAYTGLDPSAFKSGKFEGTRACISKRGSPYLRRALYLAAFALYRRHQDLNRRYRKSRKAGHRHTDALVIVAHKLARIIWRILTDNRPFKARPPKPAPNAKTRR